MDNLSWSRCLPKLEYKSGSERREEIALQQSSTFQIKKYSNPNTRLWPLSTKLDFESCCILRVVARYKSPCQIQDSQIFSPTPWVVILLSWCYPLKYKFLILMKFNFFLLLPALSESHSTSRRSIPVNSSKTFYKRNSKMQVYDPFWVNLHTRYKERDQFRSCACRHPAVAAPRFEETILLAPLLKTNWSNMYGLFLDSQFLLQDFCICFFFYLKTSFPSGHLLTNSYSPSHLSS